jgi:hypothetical protein
MRSIDSQDLTFWIAYFGVRPFGGIRGDMQMARMCTVLAKLKGNKTAKDADFMLFRGKGAQSGREIRNICRQVHQNVLQRRA